jgi:hypothetical protein
VALAASAIAFSTAFAKTSDSAAPLCTDGVGFTDGSSSFFF